MCSNIPASPALVFTSRNWFVMQGPVAIILISWNVIFIWETGYWTRAIKRFALFDLLKSYIPIPRYCRNIFCLCRDNGERWIFMKWKCIKIRKSTTTSKIFFAYVWRKNVFDIYFRSQNTTGDSWLLMEMVHDKCATLLTGFSTSLTTILPILFQYCYKYCYSDSRNLWTVMKAGGLAP
jgi:hypothetical protein